jgi:hypothetical protein
LLTTLCALLAMLCAVFAGSLVLINLLIAMMSSTYGRIDKTATTQWHLIRCWLILNVDRELQSKQDDKITIISGDDRNRYLTSNGDKDGATSAAAGGGAPFSRTQSVRSHSSRASRSGAAGADAKRPTPTPSGTPTHAFSVHAGTISPD